jgi:hypothetical protein
MSLIEGMKDLAHAAKDRVEGHVTGQFAIVWLVCNWRFAVHFLYGDAQPAERIAGAVAEYSGPVEGALRLFVAPAALTFLYLRYVPRLRVMEHRHRLRHIEEQRKGEVESNRRLTHLTQFGAELEALVTTLLGELEQIRQAAAKALPVVNDAKRWSEYINEGIVAKEALESVHSRAVGILKPLEGLFIGPHPDSNTIFSIIRRRFGKGRGGA